MLDIARKAAVEDIHLAVQMAADRIHSGPGVLAAAASSGIGAARCARTLCEHDPERNVGFASS
jgi:hypothetical protein